MGRTRAHHQGGAHAGRQNAQLAQLRAFRLDHALQRHPQAETTQGSVGYEQHGHVCARNGRRRGAGRVLLPRARRDARRQLLWAGCRALAHGREDVRQHVHDRGCARRQRKRVVVVRVQVHGAHRLPYAARAALRVPLPRTHPPQLDGAAQLRRVREAHVHRREVAPEAHPRLGARAEPKARCHHALVVRATERRAGGSREPGIRGVSRGEGKLRGDHEG
mmetsp:Transcript_16379/g.41818  ORF Transcript_16379/g.41818 Transcript_16379/m.41818 type:complete len:220 (-) Transcript_16379:1322-1981(-)